MSETTQQIASHRAEEGERSKGRQENCGKRRSDRSVVFAESQRNTPCSTTPLTLINGNVKTMTLALCDSGASRSFIDESLKDLLGFAGKAVNLNIAGIHGTEHKRSERQTVDLAAQYGDTKVKNTTLYCHPGISAGSERYDCKELKKQYPHLSFPSDDFNTEVMGTTNPGQ